MKALLSTTALAVGLGLPSIALAQTGADDAEAQGFLTERGETYRQPAVFELAA